MSLLVKKNLVIIFSSDPLTGAQNISEDNSSFSVTLNSPLKIPSSAVDCSLAVINASVWNDAANISPFYDNNVFSITSGGVNHLIAFDEGLYSLDNLQSALSQKLVNLGLASNLVVLSADNATSKVVITLLTIGTIVRFDNVASIGSILGFTTSHTSTVANQSFYGDVSAEFNRVNSFLITSDIISNGIPINSSARGIIATIPINAPAGHQCNYDPTNPVFADASELVGFSKQNLNFQLRDQSLRLVSTNEIYSFTVNIRYSILMSTEKVPMKP